jgi:hypothetical protein
MWKTLQLCDFHEGLLVTLLHSCPARLRSAGTPGGWWG